MELLQLKYFWESSKNESFAKTAEKFMVPSSSVSASVKRLEKELGCPLFDRNKNSIILNENGRRFQKTIGAIFNELDQAIFDLSAMESDDAEIKILVRSTRNQIINEIINFNKKFPTVQFKTSFDLSDNTYNDYDIIVDEENERYLDYERFELCSYRIGIKTASENPLCNRQLRLSQLRNQHFISMGEDSNLHRILVKACKKAGFTPNFIIHTNDTACYRKCIEAGMGLAPSRQYFNDASTNSTTAFLQIADFNERQTIYVYYPKRLKDGNVKRFINFIKANS